MSGPAVDLRVSLVQGDTRWHDPAGNRAYYGGLIAPLAPAAATAEGRPEGSH